MIYLGQIVASIKIFPKDIIISVDQIKEAIKNSLPNNVKVHKFVEEPIAYGLVALLAHIIIPETEGLLQKVENILQNIEGVSQTEVVLVRKI